MDKTKSIEWWEILLLLPCLPAILQFVLVIPAWFGVPSVMLAQDDLSAKIFLYSFGYIFVYWIVGSFIGWAKKVNSPDYESKAERNRKAWEWYELCKAEREANERGELFIPPVALPLFVPVVPLPKEIRDETS